MIQKVSMNNLQTEFWEQIERQSLVDNWANITDALVQSDQGYCIIPLDKIPLKRSEEITIAALSPRLEFRYYLLDSVPLKNIGFYTSDHSISCKSTYGQKLIQFFNEKIGINQSKDTELALKLMTAQKANQLDQKYIQKLSHTEFVPPTSSGIYAAICYTKDLETRKWLYNKHCHLTKDIANIERSIVDLCQQSQIDLLATYAEKDSKDHFHCFAVINQEKTLLFKQYSQSTTYNFAQNFINKI